MPRRKRSLVEKISRLHRGQRMALARRKSRGATAGPHSDAPPADATHRGPAEVPRQENLEECTLGFGQVAIKSYKQYSFLSPTIKKKSVEGKSNLLHGEAASADVDAAMTYPSQLKKIIDEGGYLPEQVFNVNETGLFWKRMPDRTFISKEEKSASGFKASKDRLTLLLGTNATGDFKLKPLLVYSFENPRALNGYAKPSLPVIWRSNRKAWMTLHVFEDWFINIFCPAVERYCAKRNIANKALLLLDNAPNHQVNLSDISSNVRVEYLPRNTTALIQPMDQGIISNFMRYYLRRTFRQLIQATEGEDKPTVRDFWKNYSIREAIDNIAKAWDEVQPSTVNSGWKSIWPECANDFTGFPPAEAPADIHRDIVQLANQAGFEDIVEEDVVHLHESHGEDVDVTEEPITQLQYTTKDLSESNRERNLKVSRTITDALTCYKELYKEKVHWKEQSTLDAFVVAPLLPPPHAPLHIISGTVEHKNMEEMNEEVLRMNKENEENEEYTQEMESDIEIKEEIKEEIEELNELDAPIKQNSENKKGMMTTVVAEHQLNFCRGTVEHKNMEEMNEEVLELKRENEMEMKSDIEIKEEDIKEEIEEWNEVEACIKQNSVNKKGMVMTGVAEHQLSFRRDVYSTWSQAPYDAYQDT